jgi:DnaJ-class molecular chaperone
MWQKCPICNGSRVIVNSLSVNSSSPCVTCNGTGLINSLSVQPPTPAISDFREHNKESQQEYFGK